jgi:hypothetical protein
MMTSNHRAFTSIGRGLAVALFALVLGGGSLAAQAGADALVGTWKGPFVSDGPTGTFTLSIAREGQEWKVSNQVETEGMIVPTSDIRDWRVEGTTFTFVQGILEFEVVFRGTLEGREIRGTVEGYQGGTLMGAGSFTLNRL